MDDGFTKAEDSHRQKPSLSPIDFDNSFTWFEGGGGDADDSFQTNPTDLKEHQAGKEEGPYSEEQDRKKLQEFLKKNQPLGQIIQILIFFLLALAIWQAQPAPVPYSVYTFLAQLWAKYSAIGYLTGLGIEVISKAVAAFYDKYSSYEKMRVRIDRLIKIVGGITICYFVLGALLMDLEALIVANFFNMQLRETALTSWELTLAMVHRLVMLFALCCFSFGFMAYKDIKTRQEKYERIYGSLRKGSVADLKADTEIPFTKTACDKSAEEFDDDTIVFILGCGHVIKASVLKEEVDKQADEELEDPECPVCQVTLQI